ncbi:MAG: hypothetical protein ACRED2_03600 [Methylocella sp.]
MTQDQRHRPGVPHDAAVGLIFRSARFTMRAKLVEPDQVALEHMHLTFAAIKVLICRLRNDYA